MDLAYLRAEGQRFRAAEEQSLLNIAALRRGELRFDAELAGVGIAVLEAAMRQAFEPARALGAFRAGLFSAK